MRSWELFLREKRCGAVLIAAFLLMALSAGGSSVLALAAANKTANVKMLQVSAMRCENAAEQADAIAQEWFENVLIMNNDPSNDDKFSIGAAPLIQPTVKMPEELLSELSAANKHIGVDVIAVDENYADNYVPEAEKLSIPFTAPVHVFVKNKNLKEQYIIKKYMLVTEITAKGKYNSRKCIFLREIAVAKDKNNDLHMTVHSAKRRYSDDK